MHAGQIFSARYYLQAMQKGEVHRLMAETLRARSELIAALIGLPETLLEAPVPNEQWTIREMAEHTIYWERHSVDELARRRLHDHLEYQPSALADVVDPIYGPLPQIDPQDHETPTPVPTLEDSGFRRSGGALER
jgi:hypothetical protein